MTVKLMRAAAQTGEIHGPPPVSCMYTKPAASRRLRLLPPIAPWKRMRTFLLMSIRSRRL